MARVDPYPQHLPNREHGPAEGSGQGRPGTLTPEGLAEWLDGHSERIIERWVREVRSRDPEAQGPLAELLPEFLGLLVSFLPIGVGRWRGHARPLFQQSAELYGNVAALRGLAAGEAVEEIQLLREVLLRFLYAEAPEDGDGEDRRGRLRLRELLQLNRIIDEGVTFASIGHMDTLFFDLLHGTGVSTDPTEEVVEEIRSQIQGLAEDLEAIQPGEGAARLGGANR